MSLSLRMLGPFEADFDGIPLTSFRTRSAQALLIYLACQPEQAHRREGLMGLFWPDLPQSSAAANLRQNLYLLRKAIPEGEADAGKSLPFIIADRQTVRVNPQADYELDVLTFQRHFREGVERWTAAVELYRGDFLCDFYLPGSAPFEEWTLAWRADLRRGALDALAALTDRAMRSGDFDGAAGFARRQLVIDNLREPAHRQLMEVLALGGHRAEAISHYEMFVQLMHDELDLEPSSEFEELNKRIRAGEVSVEISALPTSRGYELKEEIGAGAYGIVYRAFQMAAGRDVAIKIILPRYADQADFAARFEAEAHMVARLEHPHVVPLYDTWRDENGAHLVMRLLRGGSLKDLLKTGPLELEAVAKLVEHTASALDVAHQHGIVHRDIKPSNILFDEQGNAYLSDFGIAKNLAAEVTLTPTGALVGTPDYISPEQIRGEDLTTQADQYSLGLVLFEALTGVHPFAGEAIAALFHKHLTEALPLVSSIRANLSPDFDSVLQRATAKHPSDRYPDIIAFSEAFRQVVLPSEGRLTAADRPSSPIPQLPDFLEAAPEPERPVFVGREKELESLAERLSLAARGQGQVVFVSGDAGSGKTALMHAFAAVSLDHCHELLVVQGICNAFSGRGDPYLPFRQALRMLSGDVESRWSSGTITRNQALNLWSAMPLVAQAMVEHGRELIGAFVPGDSLVSRLSAVAPTNVSLLHNLRGVVNGEQPMPGELDKSALFERYCHVLRAIAKEYPVLLLLDDLQWADSGSINLLFHLVRELAGSRIFVVGAYRPEEIALGRRGERHPLAPLLDEFKREYGEIWIDLNQVEGEAFVQTFLDTEPNRLDPQFRNKLFKHTGGHALFTVELLRDLQDQRVLLQDEDGYWVESPNLNWDTLPAKIEGVIAARIGRLEEELREILSVAAVEGEDFTAQVIAKVQQLQERELLRTLSVELSRRHQLIRERSELRIGRRLLDRYRFAHALFQRYLYNDLAQAERRLLHGEIGAILEELYADRLEEITVQLAMHYAEANEAGKAVEYSLQAGDRARMQYAHREAVDHYRRALIFLEESGKTDRAARTMMKLGLTYHQALDFEHASQAYDEGFTLWRRALSMAPVVAIPPSGHPLKFDCTVPPSLDPARAIDVDYEASISNLFSGLADHTPEMDVVPDVAQSWEISDGGTRYVIHLRDDAFWSDGTPVTATDFDFAWKRILDPANRLPTARLLYDIENAEDFHKGLIDDPDLVGVRADDDHTLVVRLEGPTVYFPHLLALSVMRPVPKHVVAKYGANWAEPENIVTNGPYRLQPGDFEDHKTLVRNDAYHGRFQGNVESVVLNLPYENREVRLPMYQDNEFDILHLYRLLPEKMALARQVYADDYISPPEQSMFGLRFNMDKPPLNDGRVRQALSLAINKDGLCATVYNGLYFPANGGLIPPAMPGHSPAIGLPYKPDWARQILAEAGYPEGRGLEPIVAIAATIFADLMEFIAAGWRRELGVTVNCVVMDWDDYCRSTWDNPSHHVEPNAWSADYPDPDSFMRIYVSIRAAGRNEHYWKLVENARRKTNHEDRMATYRRADRILIEEAAFAPTIYFRNLMLVKPWVRNSWAALNAFRWKDVIVEPH